MCSPLIHSLWHNKNFKIFLSHTKLLSLSLSLSLCCRAAGDVKTYKKLFSLSLSVFLFKICCVIYHHRGRSSVHSSKRVTTGPNGLQRVRTGPVTTGSNGFDGGRGGEERSMTRLLSPHNNIIYIIYLKKILFLFIFLLSLSAIIHENIYIKKIIVIHICLYIYI